MVVLTGATRGIGQAAAVALAERGADLALVGRDPARVQEVVDEARRAATTEATINGHTADLAQMGEVRKLADELKAEYPRIDVLANNAGAKFDSKHLTNDGYEQTFALNHLAPFLLTNLLIERLASGRVVTTSSDAHGRADLDLDDLMFEHTRFRPWRAYGNSKLCNILFTRELQRRHPELTANCFHPGVIRTGFGKNDGALSRISITIAGPFFGSPEKGAAPLVHLALDPIDARGQYFEKLEPAKPSAQAQDDALASALWERSVALTE
ncbi:SDR family oxidoreductase [Solirubrobacter soli]|uniref:SDR family oxidoreductase n=1 Tax=Solirubrobacter soli TaxID=363832 RepID=UPI00069D1594|nr:SDR family oxidoreductase [Solirubrobacter soli]